MHFFMSPTKNGNVITNHETLTRLRAYAFATGAVFGSGLVLGLFLIFG